MKKNNKIQISYEPDADIVRLSWGEIKSIDHAEENGEVILHVNKKDEPVLVEILNASKVFQRPILGGLKAATSQRRSRRSVVPPRKLVTA